MNFKTIRQVAATGVLPEFRLRALQKAGKLPGFFAGSRYYVDIDALPGVLAEMCRPAGPGAEPEDA